MKYAELTRRLRQLGCYHVREAGGSYQIWRTPAAGKQATIPYHRSKDIGPDLLANILRQLGVDRKSLDQV